MVLEALAAVGLASSITQFIDFTSKLFTTATKIYLSVEGSTRDSQNLEDLTQSLQHICADLSRNSRNAQGLGLAPPKITPSLEKLGTDCQNEANAFLSVLHNLKAKKTGSKWSSFRAALSTIWKENQVNSMEKRLETYRSQLILELQVLQTGEWNALKVSLNTMYDQNRRFGVDVRSQITDLTREVRDAHDKLTGGLKAMEALVLKKKENKDMENEHEILSIRLPDVDQEAVHVPPIPRLVWKEIIDSDIPIQLAVLDSLTFDLMDFRHAKIHEAYKNTYQWIYSNQFRSWLENTGSIFWISGKPGSGKSTLMKYLVDDTQTHVGLSKWSGSRKLVITSHFFWVNGSDLQRSQEGLFRTLLYDIFRQCPELMEEIIPGPWDSVKRTMISQTAPKFIWSRAMLFSAFKNLSSAGANNTAFCMFIDGLDEYKGDHDELIAAIRQLSSLNVKICVASRPWNIFKEVYDQDTQSRLYLEDLNRKDIEEYVQGHLGALPKFQQLTHNHAQAAAILEEVVQKSQGVFLWVYLVVRSLIEGLRNEDRISQLEERLRAFPTDLEDFFRHIFDNLDPFYSKQTARMFQVTLNNRLLPFSPLTYWFMDEQEDCPQMALSMPVQGISAHQSFVRMTQITTRINGRCKGLLEVTPVPREGRYNSRVDFLHRTVRDYLMTTDVQAIIKSNEGEAFNTNLAICGALLAELKTIPENCPENIIQLFNGFFSAAGSFERTQGESPIAYLNELECTIDQQLSNPKQRLDQTRWEYLGSKFLDVAIKKDLQIFMGNRLTMVARTMTREQKTKYLSQAIRRYPLRIGMVSTILAIGPPIKFDQYFQDILARHPDDAVDAVGAIAKHIRFSRSPSNNQKLASAALWDILQAEALPYDLDDILEPISQGPEPVLPNSHSLHGSALRQWFQRRKGK